MQEVPPKAAGAEDVAHLALVLGRNLLVNGADTARVQAAVEQFARGLGFETHLLVTYEVLLLTVISGGEFRTKVGSHIEGMIVDMAAVQALNQISDDAARGALDVEQARARLDAVEQKRPLYPGWLVALALGLTAASLSWLFGGGKVIFAASFLAGTVAILLQHQLRRRHIHPLAVTFFAALSGGAVGGIAMRVHPVPAAALCLIAPGMILVPGVPLINSIRDAIHNSMSLSLARLASVLLVVAAIAFGLMIATVATGIEFPTSGATPLLPIAQDALFSALATVGYVLLFNVTKKIAWACVVCGLCSHTLRHTSGASRRRHRRGNHNRLPRRRNSRPHFRN